MRSPRKSTPLFLAAVLLTAQPAVASPLEGAACDGITDDTQAIRSLIAATGNGTLDLRGCNAAVSSTIYLYKDGSGLTNGKLTAIGSRFADDTPVLAVGNSENILVNHVQIEANHIASGLLCDGCDRAFLQNGWVHGGRRYQMKLQNGKEGNRKAQEVFVSNWKLYQYNHGEPGYNQSLNRTAYGLWVSTADCMFDNIISNYSRYPIYLDKLAVNNLFSHIHPYNGFSDRPQIGAYLNGASGNVFTGSYFDNGTLKIENNFKNSFADSRFVRSGHGRNTMAIELVTANANDTVKGLSLTNNLFSGSFPQGYLVETATGKGSFHPTQRRYTWYGNHTMEGATIRSNYDSSPAFTVPSAPSAGR